MSLAGVTDCRLVPFRGVDGGHHATSRSDAVPFEIRRAYHLTGVPEGATRGGHAHRALEQVIVAVSGSFEVCVDDGTSVRTIALGSPAEGLYVPPWIWRELAGFSAGAVCLVLASAPYEEAEYVRDYAEFRETRSSS